MTPEEDQADQDLHGNEPGVVPEHPEDEGGERHGDEGGEGGDLQHLDDESYSLISQQELF